MREYVELTDEDVVMLRLVHKPNDPQYGSAALALLFDVPRVRIERAIERRSHKHVPLNMVPGGHIFKGKTAREERAKHERKLLREYIDNRRAAQGKPKLEDTPQPRAPRRTARQMKYAAAYGENARKVSVWFKQPTRKLRPAHPDGHAPADARRYAGVVEQRRARRLVQFSDEWRWGPEKVSDYQRRVTFYEFYKDRDINRVARVMKGLQERFEIRAIEDGVRRAMTFPWDPAKFAAGVREALAQRNPVGPDASDYAAQTALDCLRADPDVNPPPPITRAELDAILARGGA